MGFLKGLKGLRKVAKYFDFSPVPPPSYPHHLGGNMGLFGKALASSLFQALGTGPEEQPEAE